MRDFKKATLICRGANANISFGYSGDGSEVDVEDRNINIDLEEINSINVFWSMVFHELAHIWCFDNEKYVIYHNDSLSEIEMSKYIRRNGLKIEQYVDKMGKKLGKESGIKFRFCPSYRTKKEKAWYRGWIEREYPL